jgi:hypothetical protein
MTLTKLEKETIISFNEYEREAHIFTYNYVWQKHLEQKLGLMPDYINIHGGKEYTISKVRIFPPRAKREYSTEAKKRMAARLAKARAKQGVLI